MPYVLPFRISPLHGLRIGEATVPGPEAAHSVTLMVTNPTTVFEKSQILAGFGASVIMLAENSATAKVQQLEQLALKQHGFRTVWGAPAPNQQHAASQPSLRGAATGVSIHSKFPIRKSLLGDNLDWYLSGRLVHAFVQIGQATTQLVSLYGMPSCILQSKSQTNDLLQAALDVVRESDYPFVIAGDLNHHPTTLTTGNTLTQLGCVTAEEFFVNSTGQPMPPTFKNSSKNDVAIFSPQLVPMLHAVHVNQDEQFAGHNPLMISLRFPHQAPTVAYWPLPHTWLPQEPDSNKTASFFDAATHEFAGDPLYRWSQRVELAIDHAIQDQHRDNPERWPATQLTRKQRGRCAALQLKRVPMTRLLKQAWQGHHNPVVDQPSLLIRQRTKQLRRMQSLSERLPKHDQNVYRLHMITEWKAIMRAPGFEKGFSSWIRDNQDVVLVRPILNQIPTVPELQVMIALLQQSVDVMCAQHVTRRKQHALFLKELDIRNMEERKHMLAFEHLLWVK